MYKGVSEAILRGDADGRYIGMRIILPSSYTGGARYMIQNYQDAMTICSWAGYPDLLSLLRAILSGRKLLDFLIRETLMLRTVLTSLLEYSRQS